MPLQIRPDYVNPLTMIRDNSNSKMFSEQSIGTVSSGNATGAPEAMQKKWERVPAELRTDRNSSGGSEEKAALKQDVDIYKKTDKEPEPSGIYQPYAGRTVKADILAVEQSYKDKLRDELESTGSLMADRSELFKKPYEMLMDGYLFGINVGTRSTLEEEASDLLKKYAKEYDEIVQGYKNGQRERYVYDSTTESGYRKVTMSEELELLDKGFKRAADLIETIGERRPEDAKACEIIANSIAKIFGEQSERAIKAREAAERVKNAVIPENISQKIIAAKKVFTEQYGKQTNIDLESILKNITIFNSDSILNKATED